MNIASVFGDAQTTVTSLVAGVGGALSTRVGTAILNRIESAEPGASRGGVGALGLQFAGRAVISAAAFSVLQGYMPQTSQNIFFSILFFAADTGLMSAGVQLSHALVNAPLTILPAPVVPPLGATRTVLPAAGGCPSYDG